MYKERKSNEEDYNVLKEKSKHFNISLETFLKRNYITVSVINEDGPLSMSIIENRGEHWHIIYIYSFVKNKGYAKNLVMYLKYSLDTEAITCHVEEGNDNSIKLWKSSGFIELDLKLSYKNNNKKLTFICTNKK